jgi:hypothetical protein
VTAVEKDPAVGVIFPQLAPEHAEEGETVYEREAGQRTTRHPEVRTRSTEATVSDSEKRRNYGVSPERFVEAWETSESAAEVAEKLQMPKAIVQARASNYRAAGIKLKPMPRRPKNKIDAAALNKRIEEVGRSAGSQ